MSADIVAEIARAKMGRLQIVAVSVCVLLNILDGFHVLVMSFTAPAVAVDWALSPESLGILFSAALVGMAAGSLFLAPYADRVGRRKIILVCAAIMSIGMLASALTTNLFQLVLTRILTGMGVGGMAASLNTIVAEYSSDKRKNLAISFMHAGYPFGAMVGGSIAAVLIVNYGWKSVFVFGGALPIVMLPVILWLLPESLEYLLARRPQNALAQVNDLLRRMGRETVSELPEKNSEESARVSGAQRLLSREFRVSSTLLWTAYFMTMSTLYFVLSWTPELLVRAGLSLQQGISGGVILNVGGILGGCVLGYVSTRFGLRQIIAAYSSGGAIFMAIYGRFGLELTYSLIIAFLIGYTVIGVMIGLYAVAARIYPADIRNTGVGLAIGIGRFGAIIGPSVAGLLLAGGWSTSALFYLFSFPLLVALLAVHQISARQISEQSVTMATE